MKYSVVNQYNIYIYNQHGRAPRITTRMVLLWLLATVRLAYMVCEQPLSSVMPWFPYVKFFKQMMSQWVEYYDVNLSGPHAEEWVKLNRIDATIIRK